MEKGEVERIAQEAALKVANAVRKDESLTTGLSSPQADVTTTVIAASENQGLLSSAAQFAENAVQGATSLAAGVAVTSAELYVGAGAKLLDAAGNVVRRGVGAVCSVQERGHQTAVGAVQTVKGTVNSVQQRGNEVLSRSAAAVLPTRTGLSYGAEGVGKAARTFPGTEARASTESPTAAQVVTSAKGAATNLLQETVHTGQQALAKAGSIAGPTIEAAGTVTQKTAGLVKPVLQAGKKLGAAAAETVTGTFRDIEQQGEGAAEAGLEATRTGVGAATRALEVATEATSSLAETATEAAHKATESISGGASSMVQGIEKTGESAAETGMEFGRAKAEKGGKTLQETAHKAIGAVQSTGTAIGGLVGATAHLATSTVANTMKEVEQQGESAAETFPSPSNVLNTGKAQVTEMAKKVPQTAKKAAETVKKGAEYVGTVTEAAESAGAKSGTSQTQQTKVMPPKTVNTTVSIQSTVDGTPVVTAGTGTAA